MMDSLVEKKISKYEVYINDVLNEDMKKIQFRLQLVNTEIDNWIREKQSLNPFSKDETQFNTQIDIGCNFYLDALVSDTSRLLMNIGLNHFLEFTADEANKYIDLRIKTFERKAEELREQSTKTNANIERMLVCISDLKNKAVKRKVT